jgi:hypothetical protein
MMTSQNPRSRTRTVSLGRARAALFFSVFAALTGAGCGLFLLLSGAALVLLVAPVLAVVFSSARAVRWHRAIRAAVQSPDAMRWRPEG